MRGVRIFLLLFIILGAINLILAEEQSSTTQDTDTNPQESLQSQADIAHQSACSCLVEKINKTGCSNLNIEEKIYTFMETSLCKDELEKELLDFGCYPKSNCKIQTTSKAILALKSQGQDTSKQIDWIKTKKTVPHNLDWGIQVDANSETSCTVSIDNSQYQFTINENKTINSQTNPCLTTDSSSYLFDIQKSCIDKEFKIECDQDFSVNVFFKNDGTSDISFYKETEFANAGSIIEEKIDMFCFSDKEDCSYSDTIWATFALGMQGESVSEYMPYINLLYDSSNEFLDPLIYIITRDDAYRTSILQRQTPQGFFKFSKNRYMDTAFALFPLYDQAMDQKDNAISWLLANQQDTGCWSGSNIKINAFLLYSVWPEKKCTSSGLSVDAESLFGNETNEILSCSGSGNFCVYANDCPSQIIEGKECSGYLSCCTSDYKPKTCSDRGGTICNKDQYCSTSKKLITEDIFISGEICCLEGECIDKEIQTQANSCQDIGGICKESCSLDESENSKYSCQLENVCCIENLDISEDSTNPDYQDQLVSDKKDLKIPLMFGIIIALILIIVALFRKKIFGKSSSPQLKPDKKTTVNNIKSEYLSKSPIQQNAVNQIYRRQQQKRTKSNFGDDDVFKKLRK